MAGDAEPATGYLVEVDGSPTGNGGTSAVAPLRAGPIARPNQSRGRPLGYLYPWIYRREAAAAFHDVGHGNSGGYSTDPGGDPWTGLGGPDGAKLLAALRGVRP